MNSLFLCCSHSNGAHNRQINENPIPPKIHIFKNMSLFFLKPGKELGMVAEVTRKSWWSLFILPLNNTNSELCHFRF